MYAQLMNFQVKDVLFLMFKLVSIRNYGTKSFLNILALNSLSSQSDIILFCVWGNCNLAYINSVTHVSLNGS